MYLLLSNIKAQWLAILAIKESFANQSNNYYLSFSCLFTMAIQWPDMSLLLILIGHPCEYKIVSVCVCVCVCEVRNVS